MGSIASTRPDVMKKLLLVTQRLNVAQVYYAVLKVVKYARSHEKSPKLAREALYLHHTEMPGD